MGLGMDTLDILLNPDLDKAAKKQEILKLNRFYERVEKYEKADSIDKKFALLEERLEKRIAAETAILTKRFQEETNRLLDAVVKALGEVKEVVMAQGKELLASIDDSDKKTKETLKNLLATYNAAVTVTQGERDEDAIELLTKMNENLMEMWEDLAKVRELEGIEHKNMNDNITKVVNKNVLNMYNYLEKAYEYLQQSIARLDKNIQEKIEREVGRAKAELEQEIERNTTKIRKKLASNW